MKKAPKYKPNYLRYEMIQGPKKMERISILPRWPALTLTSLHYGVTEEGRRECSGKLAWHEGQCVWIEVGVNYLTYVYDAPEKGNLLYTLNGEQEPWKYVAFLEEK